MNVAMKIEHAKLPQITKQKVYGLSIAFINRSNRWCAGYLGGSVVTVSVLSAGQGHHYHAEIMRDVLSKLAMA